VFVYKGAEKMLFETLRTICAALWTICAALWTICATLRTICAALRTICASFKGYEWINQTAKDWYWRYELYCVELSMTLKK
jgi:hypothetical protein